MTASTLTSHIVEHRTRWKWFLAEHLVDTPLVRADRAGPAQG